MDEMFAIALFLLSLVSHQSMVAAQEKVNQRVSRAVTPAAVSCQLSNWSEWTDCFPCQDRKYRYRSLLQPDKFGGAICSGDIWDQASCNSPTPCLRQPQCGQDFQCKETGRCLKRYLVCNGHSDCLDGSDEDNCEDIRAAEDDCSQYEPIPGSEKVALGYNILTQREAQSVYDARYYGGQCEPVYNGEWRELRYDPACERLYYGEDEKYFRKPYNFLKYHFEAMADTGMSSELYEDVNDLLSKIKNDRFQSNGITVGIGLEKFLKGLSSVNVGVSWSEDSSFLNKLSKYNEKKYSFMRIFTKVQTASFKMRRHKIMLDEGMLQSLMELPEQYDYGMYSKFIDDYGTHYITSGSMGGTYEYILVLDKAKMESLDQNHEPRVQSLQPAACPHTETTAALAHNCWALNMARVNGFDPSNHLSRQQLLKPSPCTREAQEQRGQTATQMARRPRCSPAQAVSIPEAALPGATSYHSQNCPEKLDPLGKARSERRKTGDYTPALAWSTWLPSLSPFVQWGHQRRRGWHGSLSDHIPAVAYGVDLSSGPHRAPMSWMDHTLLQSSDN